MTTSIHTVLYIATALVVSTPSLAQEVIPLWPGGAPGALGTTDRDIPRLTVWSPAAAASTGAAVIIFPGGAYCGLTIETEGHTVARWFNSFGVTAFVCEYRYGHYRHPWPSTDGQRAVRVVRSLAEERGIDPGRIGLCGFSAGAHVASTVGTHWTDGDPDNNDPVERVSGRPDFLLLIYPLITMSDPYTHQISRSVLLGDNADPSLIELLSNERHVGATTPPSFLSHGENDPEVSFQNSLMFHEASLRHGVPSTLMRDPTPGHGYGLVANWPDAARVWLEEMGLTGSVAACQGPLRPLTHPLGSHSGGFHYNLQGRLVAATQEGPPAGLLLKRGLFTAQ